MDIMFDGQQTDERILYVVNSHPVRRITGDFFVILSGMFLFAVFVSILISGAIPWIIGAIGIGIACIWCVSGILWQEAVMRDSKTYITDRRVMRFERVSPLLISKRSLFWSETLKAKAYPTNFLLRNLNIGMIEIDPIAADGEDIRIPYVHYGEDLANYIDKILYIHKTNPSEIASIPPFIAKPKGMRT